MITFHLIHLQYCFFNFRCNLNEYQVAISNDLKSMVRQNWSHEIIYHFFKENFKDDNKQSQQQKIMNIELLHLQKSCVQFEKRVEDEDYCD